MSNSTALSFCLKPSIRHPPCLHPPVAEDPTPTKRRVRKSRPVGPAPVPTEARAAGRKIQE